MELSQLHELILQGEGQKVEFKSNIPHNSILEKLIISMANSGGGYIIIGVSDDGVISSNNNFSQHDLNKIIDLGINKVTPSIELSPVIINDRIKNVIVIGVPNSDQNHFSKKTGAYYKRISDRTIQSRVTRKSDGTKIYTESGNKSYIKRFDVPDRMYPGDEIIKKVLELRPHENSLKITFLWGDSSIKIIGAHMQDDNVFEFPPEKNETVWYLKVCANQNITVECEKEVYINVEEIRRNNTRYLWSRNLAYILVGLSFVPLVLSFIKYFWGEPNLQLSIANLITVPLPLATIISFILLNKRVTILIERLSNVKMETNTKYVEKAISDPSALQIKTIAINKKPI